MLFLALAGLELQNVGTNIDSLQKHPKKSSVIINHMAVDKTWRNKISIIELYEHERKIWRSRKVKKRLIRNAVLHNWILHIIMSQGIVNVYLLFYLLRLQELIKIIIFFCPFERWELRESIFLHKQRQKNTKLGVLYIFYKYIFYSIRSTDGQ